MPPLSGKTFVLELGRDVRFKAKQELINYLREQNAHISYILTASTDYVLVSNDIDTYKTRRAKQLGISLVNVEYIYECRNLSIGKEPIDIKRFIVTSAEDKENFSKSGTIPVPGGGSSSVSTVKPVKFDATKIKIWNSDDVELPRFDEITHAEIGKWAIFKETNDNSDVYFALELQIIPEEYNNQTNNDYRIRFRYEKQTITSLKGKISLIQYAFGNDINELHQLFASYYYRIATMPRITRIRDLLPDKLGSKLLLRSLFLHRIDTQMLDENVCQLIESLWVESIGDLYQILSVKPESIALKTIIEAEAALLEIKSDSESSSEAEARFYSLIPHQQLFVVDLIKNRRDLIDKIDLCQMLRDMLTVNELTNWNIKASIEAKYRALKCHIEPIENETHEFTTISNMIHSSTDPNEQVIVHHIYSVAKQTDALNFRSTLFNQKQLFHGSKYNNFLGILSRGLLMPKMVVNDLGITRTDIGCLGYGIYFSDSVSTSLKYTTPSTTRPGRRLLCISQVALGESAKFYSYAPSLIQPPENFHSTHGVKKTNENNSKFIDDEYAIYNLDQQRLLYIVEVSWKPYDNTHESLKLLPVIRDHLANRTIASTNEVDIPSTIEDEVIQVAEQDYGLICPSSGQLIPLKAFHIRAQLVDVTAEVILYQVYHNTSSIPIEAKYVFPLDENCSVCGFEAHINNKIIKGVVKEKEQAKREYREAIEKGHGAYLMHQEQAEVFSVSVGNLPANCEVIIKITYVAELPIENNDIIFRLPAKVAAWQSKQALEMKDQTILPSINLGQENSSMKSVEFSLKTSIRMPYEILKLFSPTHRLRRKITDCLAMIELIDNVLLEKDFILSITLKSINLPRMLNETYVVSDENNNNQWTDDENSQACMLTFCPKFEMTNNSNEYVEIVFIIDVSNSMDGNHIQQAKQLAHLFLTNMKNEDGNIYFNIVTFGSDNDECFPISSPNTKENIDKAKHFVLHSLDHRGNTDLFSVLRQYSLLPSPSKLGRQFILLSDGHINDLKSILTLLANQSSMTADRFFTCSIGDTSNKHNLKQLANGTHGGGLSTVFDSNYRSRWKTKVLLLLEHIRQPCVTNISIDWHGKVDHQQEKFTNQAPKMIRSLFNGMRLTVYRFIKNCHKATLTAMINNQEFVTTVFSNKLTETKGRILNCLTARAIIDDYENGLLHIDETENELIKKQYKQDLIELSMKYSVVSSFTSFVAIEERDGQALEPGVRLVDVMLERDIDLLPYIAWDGDRSQTDIIKEKLLNAKRLFDSASISNKIDLTKEYENLCQNISYRSGGDEKYDLMLTIIDTYRMTLNEHVKARELEEKMQQDLINEIMNATADERKRLEKRLDEINARIGVEKLQHLEKRKRTSEEFDILDTCCIPAALEFDSSDFESESHDDNASCSHENAMFERERMKAYKLPLSDDSEKEMIFTTSPRATIGASSAKKGSHIVLSDDDADMGFDLFDGAGPVSYSTLDSKEEKSLAQDDKNYSKVMAYERQSFIFNCADESDEGEEMCFGLFDNDETMTRSSTNYQQEKKSSDEAKKYPETMAATPQKSGKSIPKLTEIASSKDNLEVNLIEERRVLKNESVQGKMLRRRASGFAAPAAHPAFPPHPIQQQQQQQQAVQLPAPKGSKTSNLFGITQDNSLLADKAVTPAMQPMSQTSSLQFPPSLFSFKSSITNNSDTRSGLPGLGAQAMHDVVFDPYGTPAQPPPNPPGALFSFDPFKNNNNSNNPSNYSPALGGFSFSTTLPNYAPLAPPPPPMQPHSFVPILDGASHSWSSFESSSFGGPTGFAAAAPPPPPPPLPSHASNLFGSSGSSTISNSNIPIPPVFGYQPMAMPSTVPPPPPLPPRAPNLFGSSGSSTISTSNMPPVFGYQPMAMPSTVPPPPPHPTAAAFSFNSTSFPPQKQSFSFGASSSSAHTTTLSSASVVHPQPEILTTLSSRKTVEPSSLTHDDPPLSMKFSFASTYNQTESTNVESVTIQDDDLSRVRHRKSSIPSFGRGGRGRDVALDKNTKRGYGPTLKTEEKAEPSATLQDAIYASPLQSMRYMDTRCDEQEDFGQMMAPINPVLRDESVLNVQTNSKHNKKQTKIKYQAPASVGLQDLLLLDVTPLGLGIEDINGQMCTLISRNRTIPTKTQFYSIFTNAYAYQTTATIRVFRGEHKLTKYNTFIGEFILTGLSSNFASQVLEISIRMDLDANGILQVDAIESRSGAEATIRINQSNHPISASDIERHVTYVQSDPDYQAICVVDRKANDSLYMLQGDTEREKVNFSGEIESSKDFPRFVKSKNIELSSTMIKELKRIQLPDGSFDLNEDFANLLSMEINDFDELKKYLYKQGFNSFALNIQEDIIRLIATGIILLELLLQVPVSATGEYLVPFDSERIRSILRIHLPKLLLANADKAIDFYEQKRSRYGIYCEQLELNYSSWEKFIQYAVFNMNN